MAPAVLRLYWPILVLIVCQGIIDCVNAFRPQWNPRRAALRGIVDGLSFLVIGYFLLIWVQGGTLVAVSGAKLSGAEIAAAQKGISYGWSVVLLIWAAVSYAARTFQDARRAAGKPPIHNWALRMLVGGGPRAAESESTENELNEVAKPWNSLIIFVYCEILGYRKSRQDIIGRIVGRPAFVSEDRESNPGASRMNPVADACRRGRPVLVANQFRPQQNSTGSVLFPIYVFSEDRGGVYSAVDSAWIGTGSSAHARPATV
jgi:hypothetical protein